MQNEEDRPLRPCADAHFRIGSSHQSEGTPCQDYALAEPEAEHPFAVLSDGCSLSGRTDVGARIVALTARSLLLRGASGGPDGFAARLAADASASAGQLGLSAADLDATLGMVRSTAAGFEAALIGDGIVAAATAGGLEVAVVDWAGNMPGYPCYLSEPVRMGLFLRESEEAAERHGRPACVVRRYVLDASAATELSEEGMSAEAGLRGIWMSWRPGEADTVAVLSDGAMQFRDAPWEKVVASLSTFSSTRFGSFVKRRMNKAIGRWAKSGSAPVDEVSAAALATDNGD